MFGACVLVLERKREVEGGREWGGNGRKRADLAGAQRLLRQTERRAKALLEPAVGSLRVLFRVDGENALWLGPAACKGIL